MVISDLNKEGGRDREGPSVTLGVLKSMMLATCMSPDRPAVLNLWVMVPVGVKQPFHEGRLSSLESTDNHFAIPNRNKITVMK